MIMRGESEKESVRGRESKKRERKERHLRQHNIQNKT
jgi:hypothetical protein